MQIFAKKLEDQLRERCGLASKDIRIDKREIFKSLAATRELFEEYLHEEVYFRFSGAKEAAINDPDLQGRCEEHTALEYLVDFSFSAFSIPEAIGQKIIDQPVNYEMLLAVESELGTLNEVCRDLLKLLDVKAALKCLIYSEPRRKSTRERLYQRILRVFASHSHPGEPDSWILLGLAPGEDSKVKCEFRGLSEGFQDLVSFFH